MESIEFKMKSIDNTQFLTAYTKKVIEILREPQLSAEVNDGKPSEEVSRLLESLGYNVDAKKYKDGWVALKAVKKNN
jgi:hypothetical protein